MDGDSSFKRGVVSRRRIAPSRKRSSPNAQEEWTSLKLLPPALVCRRRLAASVGRSFELFERLWRTKVVFVAPPEISGEPCEATYVFLPPLLGVRRSSFRRTLKRALLWFGGL